VLSTSATGAIEDYDAVVLVSCALSSWLKCGILWHGENWTSQAGVGVD
jgi:hypothetical protein